MKEEYTKFTEIHDSTFRKFAEDMFSAQYIDGYFISDIVKNGEKWIVKLEKKLV